MGNRVTFRDEQEFIERYVRLLRARSTLHDRQVQDLNRILKRVHVDQLPVRRHERTGKDYTADELEKLVNAIRVAEPEVYQTILGHEQGLDTPSFGLDGPAAEYASLVEYMDRLDEWIDYFADQLSDDPEEESLELPQAVMASAANATSAKALIPRLLRRVEPLIRSLRCVERPIGMAARDPGGP